MAPRLLRRWLSSKLGIDAGIVSGNTAVFFDQTAGCVGVFLTDDDDGSTDSGKDFLLGIKGRDIAIDVCGFEKAADDEGLGFLLGIKDPDQLLVRVGTLVEFFHHSASKYVIDILTLRLRCGSWVGRLGKD